MEPNDNTRPDFSVEGEEEALAAGEHPMQGEEAEGEQQQTGAAPALDPAALAAVAGEGEGDGEEQEQGAGNVPMARFSRVNAKLQDALRENERLKGQIEGRDAVAGRKDAAADDKPAEPAVDLKDLRKQHRQALYAGDDEAADRIEEQIEAERNRQLEAIRQEAETRAYNRIKTESAATLLNETADRLAQAHPFLDSNSDEANPDAIAEVVALRNAYQAKGQAAHVALENAVKKIVKLYGADPATDGASTKRDELAQARERKALETAGATSRAQPAPLTAGQGARAGTGKLDAVNLTDDQIRQIDKKAMFAGSIE